MQKNLTVAVVNERYGVRSFFQENTKFKVIDWKHGMKDGYDIMAFTGGEDIDPALYGEKPIRGTYFTKSRDELEINAYLTAPDHVIKVGICRGAQLLNVLSGGKLWQNVNNHSTGHHATDTRTGLNHFVSSVHHQVMKAGPGAEILAVAQRATSLANEKTLLTSAEPAHIEIEAVWYPKTKSLCFQGHPEFGPKTCEDYFLSLLMEKVNEQFSTKAA